MVRTMEPRAAPGAPWCGNVSMGINGPAINF